LTAPLSQAWYFITGIIEIIIALLYRHMYLCKKFMVLLYKKGGMCLKMNWNYYVESKEQAKGAGKISKKPGSVCQNRPNGFQVTFTCLK